MKQISEYLWKTSRLFLASTVWLTPVFAQQKLVVDSLVATNRAGLETILQGNAAGVRIKSWTGTAGMQAVINIRGLSMDPTDAATQPLILLNGVPLLATPSQFTGINPLSYYNPEQVERIEIIKSADQLAAYGVQAPNGALNIVMKEGKTGALHVRASALAGVNFLSDNDYRKDAFYDFNTIARRKVYGNGGLISEQNVMVDGGGDYGSYLFGMNNHQDKGTINGSSFGRQSLFLNARYHISPRLTAHFYNNLALAARNGRYAGEYNRQLQLPVVRDEAMFMDKKRNVAFFSSIGLKYELTEGLSISTLAGLSYEGASRDAYLPSNILLGKIFSSSDAQKKQLLDVHTSLNYKRSLPGNWAMDLALGNEIRTTDYRLTSVDGGRSLESGGSDYVKVVNGYNALQSIAYSDHDIERIIGFYGSGKWKHGEDLQVNLVLRADGSSLYQKKWALYPAAGVVYNLANALKVPLTLRASAGKMGMLNRPGVYRGELTAKGNYFGGNELGIGELYAAFRGAASVDVYQLDAGLTYEISPVISLAAEVFSKTYDDFLYRRFLPNIHGKDYSFESGGKIGLSGLEFSLDGRWIQTENFGWSTAFNTSWYKNRVIKMPANIGETDLSHLGALKKGDPVTALTAFESGREKVVGNSAPKLFGGMFNRLHYRQFSAGFTVSFASRTDILAESYGSRYAAEAVGNQFPIKNNETPYYFEIGDARQPGYQGIRTIENGAFVRLSSAEIAYNFNRFLEKLSLSELSVFLRGDNLFMLSRYSGINPEENLNGIRKTDLSLTGTPLPASVAAGLKLVF